jgi:hypothetical protein
MKRLIVFSAILVSFLCLSNTVIAKDIGYYLELGDSFTAGQFTLKEGVIRVEKKGSPVDGLQIIVPPGAYDTEQTFTIKFTQVKKFNVPDYVISPLISITGPQQPANGFLIIKIPCKVPANSQAVVFFYDDKDKFTDSLPPGPRDVGYVTAMTKVLKDMVVVAQKVDYNSPHKK